MEKFLSQEGQNYRDFALVKSLYIEELQSQLRELIHIPSGAQVLHLENEDPENLFCLSFKTLPDSSNGAPHILEHTVLCGSRKFPVKDPFFSMTRRSLNTYMNALTGADFTCYPASSQVEKDFYNLLEVFIDAVFHPELKEMSFMQEGHRLEFEVPDDPKTKLAFKGIVYNEMKGALSSADARISDAIVSYLVPDLPYAHNSGGDPKEIPSLTYADLVAFHEKFYHPSRCLFFFYGNFPLKKHLDFIEEHALKRVEKLPPLDGIGHQKRFQTPVEKTLYYPYNQTKNLETKAIIACGWLTTFLLNQEEVLILTLLDAILMDTDASPLKKALLETNLFLQAECSLDTEMTEVPFTFLFRGCKKEDSHKIKEALFKELAHIAKTGIAYSQVEASLHQLEFSRLEIGGGHSPFGLTLFMRSALSKQHGCAPENALVIQSLFNSLREKTKDPHFFTPYIEKYFLNNPHFVQLTFLPDPKLSSKEAQEEQEKLEEIKKKLTEKEKAKIVEQAKELKAFQKKQEGQKVDCLPKVTLADVPAQTRHFSLERFQRKEMQIFYHEAFTNHIVFADLIFSLPCLSEEELFDLQLFLILQPQLGIGTRNYTKTLEYIYAHTGGISPHALLYPQIHNVSHLKPSLQFHGSCLGHKIDKFFPLLKEYATLPRFDEKKRMKESLKKLGNSLQHRLPQNAMRYAIQLALSGLSLPSYINQSWYGITFYKKIQLLVKELDQNLSPLMDRLEALKKKILSPGPPDLVLSCDRKLFEALDKDDFFGLTDFPSHTYKPWDFAPTLPGVPNQAVVIPSPVAFTAQGFKSIPYAHPDSPAMQVATVLFENKILHHRIRELGGAYGAGANYNSLAGNFYFYAFRDPHIAHTLHTFETAIQDLAHGLFDGQDLEEAKLGIIQSIDTPVAPGNRAIVSYHAEKEGRTRQVRQHYRDTLLSLSPEKVAKALHTHLLNRLHEGVISTFAGKELLDKELSFVKEKNFQVFDLSS